MLLFTFYNGHFVLVFCVLWCMKSSWLDMTALESWCLAMIGLVFESLLAYVIVLLCLFKAKACQVPITSKFIFSFQGHHADISCFQVSPEKENHVPEGKRSWRLELFLFSWVMYYCTIVLILIWYFTEVMMMWLWLWSWLWTKLVHDHV